MPFISTPTSILSNPATNPGTVFVALQNDSSTATVTPSVPSSTVTAGTSVPTSVIDTNSITSAQYATYRFPSDTPKYYIQLDLSQYSRTSLTTVGNQNTYASIILPIPQQLQDPHQEKWAEVDIGIIGGNAAQSAAGLGGRALAQIGAAAGAEVTVGAAGGVAGKLGSIAGVNSAVNSGFNVAKVLAGIAPNEFSTILFVGPQYRRINLQWKMTPKTQGESETLRQIAQVLNNAQAPALAFNSAIFAFPDIVTCSFWPNCRWLYKFKPAVIQSLTFDYAPGGVPAFYHSTTSVDNAPESVSLNLQLIEIEYWTKGNFTASNEPGDVYNQTAPDNAAITGITNTFNFLYNNTIGLPTTQSVINNPANAYTGNLQSPSPFPF